MKGLTPREYAELRDLAGPEGVIIDFADDETASVLNSLVEQGRVSVCFEATPDDPRHEGYDTWSLTEQGRKAMELYLRIQGDFP